MFQAKRNLETERDQTQGASGGDVARDWSAPEGQGALDATVEIPGSKSLTNRELILAALADGPGILRAPLHSRDSALMIAGLRSLGVEITEGAHTGAYGPDLHITPAEELRGSTSIDCGLAGTVMRFLPPVAALALGPVGFDGDPYARKRPMRDLVTALRDLGVDIADDGRGALPFTVHGTGSVAGGPVTIDASRSSQFVSALLLSAPRFDRGVTVTHEGDGLPSVPHIEMTLETLRNRGVDARSSNANTWQVAPGPIEARELTIEPDLSNAAPFLAAALVCGGTVRVPNWPAQTTQVGDSLRMLLTAFGAEVALTDGVLNVTGTGTVQGVELHIPEAGELAPTLVGLAALAETPSTITGIGHIRHHETDRIRALVDNIRALGGYAEELEDGIAITPAPLHGGHWPAYADHRMATTGALIGLRVSGVTVDDIDCTSKTLPQFTELWSNMLSGVNPAKPKAGPNPLSGLLGAGADIGGLGVSGVTSTPVDGLTFDGSGATSTQAQPGSGAE